MDAYSEELGKDLKKLLELGDEMMTVLLARFVKRKEALARKEKEPDMNISGYFERMYQVFYTGSYEVIRQISPERLPEFENLYLPSPKRKKIDEDNYTIQDWLLGKRSGSDYLGERIYADFGLMWIRFGTQLRILESVQTRFDSASFDTMPAVQADSIDPELETSREVSEDDVLRAADLVSGISAEEHLWDKLNHPLLDGRTSETLGRLDKIQYRCDREKRLPTQAEYDEMMDGVANILRTLA